MKHKLPWALPPHKDGGVRVIAPRIRDNGPSLPPHLGKPEDYNSHEYLGLASLFPREIHPSI